LRSRHSSRWPSLAASASAVLPCRSTDQELTPGTSSNTLNKKTFDKAAAAPGSERELKHPMMMMMMMMIIMMVKISRDGVDDGRQEERQRRMRMRWLKRVKGQHSCVSMRPFYPWLTPAYATIGKCVRTHDCFIYQPGSGRCGTFTCRLYLHELDIALGGRGVQGGPTVHGKGRLVDVPQRCQGRVGGDGRLRRNTAQGRGGKDMVNIMVYSSHGKLGT